MLRGAWRGGRGRRGAIAGASAVVLCAGGLLAACGGDGREGHVATGSAGDGRQEGRGGAVAPSGDVEFVPLDGRPSGRPSGKPPTGPGGEPSREGGTPAEPEGGGNGPVSGGSSDDGPDEAPTPGAKSPGNGGSSRPPDATGNPPPDHNGDDEDARPGTPGDNDDNGGDSSPPARPGTPPAPAALEVGEPRRRAAEKRWCEDVTVSFRNTGGSPVRSGSVTLGTHIIGALGVDWGTIEATRKLPAPIGAGKTVKKTWPICVDWWRVPLGMRVETRDVDVEWK